ncbi:MAG TPA: hypothetical protein VFZ48_05110 [Candidatus Saccharimonadales bacterium]
MARENTTGGAGKTSVARKLNELGFTAFDSKINKGIFHFADDDGNDLQQSNQ